MTRRDNKAENQHYVPQSILRNFTSRYEKRNNKPDQHYIYAFDKHNDKVFEPNVAAIASERGFYEFFNGETKVSLERMLSELEGNTSVALNKIISNENLVCLNNNDIEWLTLFIVVQFLRVKSKRELVRDIHKIISKLAKKAGFDVNNIQGYKEIDVEEIKLMTMESFWKDSPTYCNALSNKNWLLLKNKTNKPLYIGDSPVVMHNDKDLRPYSNIGFSVPGIQIYFPISSRLILAFWCPTIMDELKKQQEKLQKDQKNFRIQLLMSSNVDVIALKRKLEQIEKMTSRILSRIQNHDQGLSIDMSEDNIDFYNALQVRWSHRFVMCSKNNFDLVRKMISDNEDYRYENKITFK